LCQTRNGTYGNAHDVVMGTKGTCYLGENQIDGEKKWKFKGPYNNPYDTEQKALVDSILSGNPINSGYHMARSTLSTVMGQMACYTGKQVTWDEAGKSNLQWGPAPDVANFETPPPTKPDQTGNYPLPIPGITTLS
jgi:hypothetical protein